MDWRMPYIRKLSMDYREPKVYVQPKCMSMHLGFENGCLIVLIS